MSVPIINTMRYTLLLPALACLPFIAASCQKTEEVEPTPTNPLGFCGIDGYRLKATYDGAESCFSSSLIGAQADLLTINGIAQLGSTLTLQLNDVAVGTHSISGDVNHMLLTVLGTAYESANTAPGTLTVTSHDESGNRIKGNFSVQMSPLGGGPSKTVTGSFDITYVE